MCVNQHRHQRQCSGETEMHNLRQMPLCLEAFGNVLGATDCTFSIFSAAEERLRNEKIYEKHAFLAHL